MYWSNSWLWALLKSAELPAKEDAREAATDTELTDHLLLLDLSLKLAPAELCQEATGLPAEGIHRLIPTMSAGEQLHCSCGMALRGQDQ